MTMVIYWYDLICFTMIAGAILTSIWVIFRKEGGEKGHNDNSMYESLLQVNRPDSDDIVKATRLGHLGSDQLWTSCWRGVHPGWLLATRFGSFVVMAGFQIWDVMVWDSSIYVYYTEWTFTLVIVYFALGTLISAHGCWVYSSKPPPSENGERSELLKKDMEENGGFTANGTIWAKKHRAVKLHNHYVQEEIQQIACFWGYLMQIIFQTCAGAVVLTDVVFWCVIVPFQSNAHFDLNMLMGCMHTLNVVFLLLDTSLNSLPFPWFRLSYFVLWSCLYILFQWIIHACGFSWWPYPFLELSTAWAPLWYFCLALVHIPCYGIFALLMKAKVSFFSRLFPHAFVRSY